MDPIINQMQNLDISKDSLLGKDLKIKNEFLHKLELSFQNENFEQKIDFSYYVGKYCMCVSFKSSTGHGDARKLVKLTEEHFAWEKLRELGWCVNYMMYKEKK